MSLAGGLANVNRFYLYIYYYHGRIIAADRLLRSRA